MITILSPAKTLDFDSPRPTVRAGAPRLLDDSADLIAHLREYDAAALSRLMKLSDSLSRLNVDRNRTWTVAAHAAEGAGGAGSRGNEGSHRLEDAPVEAGSPTETEGPVEAGQALFAFKGEVYRGFAADDMGTEEIDFAQEHLRILSGLYGVLRPLDLILPHRLEMGTRLPTDRGATLYDYWGRRLTETVLRDAGRDAVIVNLASKEYFKAVRDLGDSARVVTPVFKEQRRDGPKVVGVHAKYQRGRMARYITYNRIDTPEALVEYDLDGYTYAPELSGDEEWVFLR